MQLNQWEYEYIKRQIAERQKKYARQPKKKTISTAFVVTAILLSLFAALIGFAIPVTSKLMLLDMFIALGPRPAFINECNILILGADEPNGGRSDTIMVVHIDPDKREAKIVSIPRDTRAEIPGRGLDKLNHAFAFGGAELSMSAISNFLQVPIPYYIKVDIDSLTEIIDELGGITVNVEKRMYYVDYAGNLDVDLWPGIQKLNGHQAVAYLRYRTDGGDFKRINRQQGFLQAVASQMMARDNITRSPGIFLKLVSSVHTNMTSRQILGTALAMRSAYETGQIQMTSLGGKDHMIDGIYYLEPDQTEVMKIVNEYLRPQSANKSVRNFLSNHNEN